MKETIEFYYNLKVENLMEENNAYHFINNGNDYYFVYWNRDKDTFNEILDCIYELKNRNVNCHDIIYNIKKELLTPIEDTNYVLLKVLNKNKEYNIIDIIHYNKLFQINNDKKRMYRNNWAVLWSSKVDYIETQLKEIKTNNIILSSVDYYLGLCENAISYVNNVSLKYQLSNSDNIVLSHKRLYYPNYHLNYFNPLSFIFDLEVRDVAEYIKSMFFKKEDAFFELQTYLKSVNLSIYSYNMLYARLLYPSYYFDIFDKVINNHYDEENLLKIINLVDDYEIFLKKAYNEISLYAPLENIEWLIVEH